MFNSKLPSKPEQNYSRVSTDYRTNNYDHSEGVLVTIITDNFLKYFSQKYF